MLQKQSTATPKAMTLSNAMTKVAVTFGVLLVALPIGWMNPALVIPAAIASFALGMTLAFMRHPTVAPLILLFAALEGVAVGGISAIYNAQTEGLVVQAICATLAVLSVLVLSYGTPLMRRIRSSSRIARTVVVSMIGYAVFSIINFILMITGTVTDPWGLRTAITIPGTEIPLGVVLGVVAILLASYCFTKDLEMIEDGITTPYEAKYGWTVAFMLVLNVVWMYLEILRLLAILRN